MPAYMERRSSPSIMKTRGGSDPAQFGLTMSTVTSALSRLQAFGGSMKRLRYVGPLVLILLAGLTISSHGNWLGDTEAGTVETLGAGLSARNPEVIQALSTTYLQPPSTLPYNLSQDPSDLAYAHLDTWSFINHYITRIFKGEHRGFFVEAGALDGQQLSNTLWLEQELGWTGLLIEPNPYSYQDLRHKHRKAWTSNSCISSDSVTKTSVHVSLRTRKGYVFPKWFMRGSSHEYGVSLTMENNKLIHSSDETYVMTFCFPLQSYLLALNVTTVDMLSLDTQGSEIDIIKTIPWEEINIRVIIVEIIDYKNFQTDFVKYMKGKGYVLVGNFIDYIFVKEDDAALTRLQSHSDWKIVGKAGK